MKVFDDTISITDIRDLPSLHNIGKKEITVGSLLMKSPGAIAVQKKEIAFHCSQGIAQRKMCE
jgi:hypothetical protein